MKIVTIWTNLARRLFKREPLDVMLTLIVLLALLTVLCGNAFTQGVPVQGIASLALATIAIYVPVISTALWCYDVMWVFFSALFVKQR